VPSTPRDRRGQEFSGERMASPNRATRR
jgi:hypothetical protein